VFETFFHIELRYSYEILHMALCLVGTDRVLSFIMLDQLLTESCSLMKNLFSGFVSAWDEDTQLKFDL
jgi:hypothetical protein